MKRAGIVAGIAFASGVVVTAAFAQTDALEMTPVEPAAIDAIEEDRPIAVPVALDEPEPLDEDAITRELNASQRLEQTFTLRRTVNGELVETTKRSVALPRGAAAREAKPGQVARERVLAAFDGEVLSRLEALEEAKFDFTAADTDENGLMSRAEFEALVDNWRVDAIRQAGALSSGEDERQEMREAFLAEMRREIDPDRPHTDAARKFAFMAGAAQTMSREDYVREYMLDFDSMDANKDMLLVEEELVQFRALNRGETTEM